MTTTTRFSRPRPQFQASTLPASEGTLTFMPFGRIAFSPASAATAPAAPMPLKKGTVVQVSGDDPAAAFQVTAGMLRTPERMVKGSGDGLSLATLADQGRRVLVTPPAAR